MKKGIIYLFTVFIFHSCYAQSSLTTVFRSGEDGYQSYRIPAIIHLTNGDLLAFCEGRKNGAADFGDNDIVMKRSSDNGKSWSFIEKIVEYNNLQASNSAPVVDLSDSKYPKGRIFLFYNTGNNHEYDVRMGNGLREVWYITSVDQGKNWSVPDNITSSVHRPNQAKSNANYQFAEDWRAYANTPGHALQIKNGKYKGRIIVPANHSSGNPQNDYSDYKAHAFYSDDHGKSFQLSDTVDFPGSNESTAVELKNGNIMLNSRNQKGDIKVRIVTISKDGGKTWGKSYLDHQLPDPVNEGTLLNLGTFQQNTFIAFCNAADTKDRNNLTLKISKDEGKSWYKSFLIDKNPTSETKDFTAYSDIVKINNNKIGVLYERNNYQEIVFTTVKWR